MPGLVTRCTHGVVMNSRYASCFNAQSILHVTDFLTYTLVDKCGNITSLVT